MSLLISDARLRRDAADRARGTRMQRREEWMKAAKLGLYAEPGEMEKHIQDAKNATTTDETTGWLTDR